MEMDGSPSALLFQLPAKKVWILIPYFTLIDLLNIPGTCKGIKIKQFESYNFSC